MWDVRRLAEDSHSGAGEIAHRAAVTLSALPRSDLVEAVRFLVGGHPSMAPLWRLGLVVLSADDHARAAQGFARKLSEEADRVAAAATGLLTGPVVTLSYSSTMVSAVAAAGCRAWCARSDPGGEGALTVARLREHGVTAHLVEDDRAAARAAAGRTVVVGADAIGPGGVVNKVGTRRLAEAAAGSNATRYVVAGTTKLIGDDLPAPLPFERTPLELFTGVITEQGAVRPNEVRRMTANFPLDGPLRHLL